MAATTEKTPTTTSTPSAPGGVTEIMGAQAALQFVKGETWGFDRATVAMTVAQYPELQPREVAQFLYEARRLGLDPGAGRQIYAIVYNRNDPSKRRLSVQIGIDGLRAIAAKTGAYDGSGEAETDEGIEEEVPGPFGTVKIRHPTWARASVRRAGAAHPFVAKVRWEERAKKDREGRLTEFWVSQPFSQLEKCAESAALRKAFPMETQGLAEEGDPEPHRVEATVIDAGVPSPAPGTAKQLPPAWEAERDEIALAIRSRLQDPALAQNAALYDRIESLISDRLDAIKIRSTWDAKEENLPAIRALRDDISRMADGT